MTNRQKNRPKKTDRVDEDDVSMDRPSLDGVTEEEEDNVSCPADGANILAAIQSMRADFSTQLREVISSNQEIKEAIDAFSERLTSAETRISKAEDDISSLSSMEKALQTKCRRLLSSWTISRIETEDPTWG